MKTFSLLILLSIAFTTNSFAESIDVQDLGDSTVACLTVNQSGTNVKYVFVRDRVNGPFKANYSCESLYDEGVSDVYHYECSKKYLEDDLGRTVLSMKCRFAILGDHITQYTSNLFSYFSIKPSKMKLNASYMGYNGGGNFEIIDLEVLK